MDITIKSKNIELTPSLYEYIETKFKLLEKFIKNATEFSVEVEKENKHHRKGDVFWVKAQLSIPGKVLMAQAHGEDMMNVVVEAKEQLEGELRKEKTKTVDMPRRKYQKAKLKQMM